MADILIRGMEMPIKKNGAILIIYPNGKCLFEDGQQYEAVELPEHGDLIDRDDLPLPAPIEDEYKRVREIIRNAPVIIPASEEEIE